MAPDPIQEALAAAAQLAEQVAAEDAGIIQTDDLPKTGPEIDDKKVEKAQEKAKARRESFNRSLLILPGNAQYRWRASRRD